MFAHFRPFWHFVFHAAAAATAVPLALRLPHRPLLLALVQCVANALLKPYPSVGDVAQYLVSNSGSFPVSSTCLSLFLALVQCVANALLRPHPSVGDVAHYLVDILAAVLLLETSTCV